MKVEYWVQPAIQLGNRVLEWLRETPPPKEVVLVSAFANSLTVARLRDDVQKLRGHGTQIRVILGIDLDGTSEETLREVVQWRIDGRIVHNRRRGHTFHPKIYLFERENRADIIIGSHNLTEGGFYCNYEAGVRVSYDLPEERSAFDAAKHALQKAIAPNGTTCKKITKSLIDKLVARRQVLPRDKKPVPRIPPASRHGSSPFGDEPMPSSPSLPPGLAATVAEVVAKSRRLQLRRKSKSNLPLVLESPVVLNPTTFYFTITPTRKRPTAESGIPGEGRIRTWAWYHPL